MAKKPTAAEKKAAAAAAAAAAPRNLLAEAVNARNTGAPLMATEAEMAALTGDPRGPLAEFNPNIRQGDKIAFRATELGAHVHNTATQAPTAPAWGVPAPTNAAPQPQPQPQVPAATAGTAPTGPKTFNFDAGIPLPAPRRGGRGSAVYGFEQMEVGASFFIPTTAENVNPAKRVASTVSSASERLAPRKFVVRSVDETSAGRGKGARVWRTA